MGDDNGKRVIRLVDCSMAYDGEVVLNNINLYINDSKFLTLLIQRLR